MITFKNFNKIKIIRIFFIITSITVIFFFLYLTIKKYDFLTKFKRSHFYFERAFDIAKTNSILESVNYIYTLLQKKSIIGDLENNPYNNNLIIENTSDRKKLPIYKIQKGLKESFLSKAQKVDDNIFLNWTQSYGNIFSSKYSGLDNINLSNISKLNLNCIYYVPKNNLELNKVQTNPIFFQNAIYTSNHNKEIISLDPETCKLNWSKLFLEQPAKRGIIGIKINEINKNVLLFPSGNRLYCLYSNNGEPCEFFNKKGYVSTFDPSVSTPIIYNNKIYIFNSSPSILIFNLLNGKLEYRLDYLQNFNRKNKFALEGGSSWVNPSFDPVRKIIFFSTGNPRPANWGISRPGNNQNTSSVIAFDIINKKIIWSFQEVHHDLWDLDIASPPILTSIIINKKEVDVVVTPTKLGNILILDRISGKPVFDYREKLAPTSNLPGEITAPYQPFLTLPEPLELMLNDTKDLLIDNLDVQEKEIINNAKIGFFETPEIGKILLLKGLHGGPSWDGGSIDHKKKILYVNSQSAISAINIFFRSNSFPNSKKTGKKIFENKCASCHGYKHEGKYISHGIYSDFFTKEKYAPSLLGISFYKNRDYIKNIFLKKDIFHKDIEMNLKEINYLNEYFSEIDIFLNKKNDLKLEFKWQLLIDRNGYPITQQPWGTINAMNLNNGKIIWKKPFGNYDEITNINKVPTGQNNRGGIISTAGNIVIANGTIDKKLRIFNSNNGDEIWSYNLNGIGSAPPSTFLYKNKQYIITTTSIDNSSVQGLGSTDESVNSIQIFTIK